MFKACDTCGKLFSLISQSTTMPSKNLPIILLVTMFSCNISSLPVKHGFSDFSDWLLAHTKSFAPSNKNMQAINKDPMPIPKPCTKDVSKIIFPIKYRHDDKLADPVSANIRNLNVNLPIVHQPYENYKVLVATAPTGMELGENGIAPITVYIVFNDEKNYPSVMNLPTVYFVRKRPMTHKGTMYVTPILVLDSNRTVTGLRSKEIRKFVKFSNTHTSH